MARTSGVCRSVDETAAAQLFDHGVGEFHIRRSLRQRDRRQIVHAAQQHRALAEIRRQALFLPAARQHHAGQMRARGMRRDINAVAVAAEALGVPVDPAERAPHLLVHRKQIAAGLIDIDEVDDDAMRAGANERLGLHGVIRRDVPPPGAAVNEHVDRRALDAAVEDVEPFVLARPVGDALWHAENRAGPLARGLPPLDDQRAVRRPDFLVVGVVQRLLVHVEEDQRAQRTQGSRAAEPECTFMAGRLTQASRPGHIARRRARP